MNRKQRIYNLLTKNFSEFLIEIIDNSHLHVGHNKFDGSGETHIQILLKKKNTKGINKINIHRKIYNILESEFTNGLHSLEIKIN
tara:strand:- start:661 stop:915 length:255 start_codon:yes stop_codon:yes gene_type:complete